jgi:hypothetical protein
VALALASQEPAKVAREPALFQLPEPVQSLLPEPVSLALQEQPAPRAERSERRP